MFGISEELKKKVEKHSGQFYKILKSSLSVKDEQILIISDYGTEGRELSKMLAYGYHYASLKKGYTVQLVMQEIKKGFKSV